MTFDENIFKDILDKLSVDFDKYDYYNNIIFNADEIMDMVFENYFDEIEGLACCADKSSFVVSKIKQALKERKNQSLQYTYQQYKDAGENLGGITTDLDHICYWCPKTIKDTDEAIDLYFMLLNSGKLLKQIANKDNQIKVLNEELKMLIEDK